MKTIRTPQGPLQEHSRPHCQHRGPQHILSQEIQCHHFPNQELLQAASQRIKDLPPKQPALVQCTPFDQCFLEGSSPQVKLLITMTPGCQQQVAAQGFQTTNANTPQWSCNFQGLEIDPDHAGVPVHPASSHLQTIQDLLG